MKTDTGPEETQAVDMAAMMDCIFLLLIFFLVAATIRKKHNELPIQLPEATNEEKVTAPDDTLVVSMIPRGKGKLEYRVVTVGEAMKSTGGAREVATLNELRLILKEAALKGPDRAVRIDADKRIPYGKVTQVIDHCQLYQLKRIGLRTHD